MPTSRPPSTTGKRRIRLAFINRTRQ
jgi:hypothetical protein